MKKYTLSIIFGTTSLLFLFLTFCVQEHRFLVIFMAAFAGVLLTLFVLITVGKYLHEKHQQRIAHYEDYLLKRHEKDDGTFH